MHESNAGAVAIVTHNGGFHTDDALAVAVLLLHCEQRSVVANIVRTRDQSAIEHAEYVVDVGGIYDATRMRFDHHQLSFDMIRVNGIPYASAGLVWKSFGLELCGQNQLCSDRIDSLLFCPVDAIDNGKSLITGVAFESVYPFDLASITSMFYPTENMRTVEHYDVAFLQLVTMFKSILSETIKTVTNEIHSEQLVRTAYEQAADKRIIELDIERKHIPVLCNYPEPLFVVYQKSDGNWSVKSVRAHGNKDFTSRILFPVSWRGLRDNELTVVSGISDAVFCHSAGFLFVTSSRDSALAVAQSLVHI